MIMRYDISFRFSEDRDDLVLANWFDGGEELIEAACCGSDTPAEADERLRDTYLGPNADGGIAVSWTIRVIHWADT